MIRWSLGFLERCKSQARWNWKICWEWYKGQALWKIRVAAYLSALGYILCHAYCPALSWSIPFYSMPCLLSYSGLVLFFDDVERLQKFEFILYFQAKFRFFRSRII